mgnify:CR=1 FL=1
MYIVHHRTFFFWFTGIILAAALGAYFVYGLPPGIDFTGGSLLQVRYEGAVPPLATIQRQVATVPLGAVSVRASGDSAVSIRTRIMTPAEHEAVLAAISANASTTATELAYASVGPALGSQFAGKALWAILAVVLAIILYITFAFRKVSRPVPSWGYGLTVVAILVHDIIIPAGFFALLAHFTGAEVDALFVTALLALLGYSVNDTIIIFDRVREHLHTNEKKGSREEFSDTVGKSITETMTRSINTSLTVVLALLALVLVGASATRVFALVMLVGVVAGTYSSILLAAPLLITLSNWFVKK